jgi:HEPN domain-containing protein
VTNTTLGQSYLAKARARLRILPVLAEQAAWSDVIREAQEIVELALKGMLRQIGVEPPKWHDVGGMIEQYRDRLPPSVAAGAPELARISARLRKEREFSFYGDIDFIPTEQYTEGDAVRAMDDARTAVEAAAAVIDPPRA